jgi:hypothetical protein
MIASYGVIAMQEGNLAGANQNLCAERRAYLPGAVEQVLESDAGLAVVAPLIPERREAEPGGRG